ncbi:alkaline phosphatase [Derxia gummosa]|uniref:Alkaline phosphatase n=1 Tax=Derxia gummosa DSM 723 TaxID=1121388 RepID=A0A8B6X4Y9_9BURK|nr:alkaline phosphatase [Derxia gummosa]
MQTLAKPRLARVAAAVALAATAAGAALPAHAAGEAKNIIFFLGDGMGPVPKTAARIYKYGEAGSLTMDTLPYTARVKTYSLDAQTTDSAPSMAAYMTGVKQRNEVLGMNGDTVAVAPGKDPVTGVSNAVNNCLPTNGAAVTTLIEYAIAKGKATGAVTTARLTHATPAATYAHICHRDTEYEIARQAVPGGAGFNARLGNGVDVLMGGISSYWRPYNAATTPKGRPDGRDLVAELQAKGYSYASDLTSFNALPTAAGTKVIALFDQALSQGHMSYEADRDPTKEPSLAEMTVKAIDILSKNSNGYFLMVEGGRIDHALHGTNAYRAVTDTVAFDDAIKAALGKVDLSNTLIVVTADHDHTMAFNGYGKKGTPILGLNVNYATGRNSLDADGLPYTTLVFGGGSNRPDVRATLDSETVQGKDYLQEVVIRRGAPGSETHGGGDVQLYSTGAGSKSFKGTIDNTRVFTLVKSAGGL